MTLRDFRIGWRTLIQQPAYSLVVVLGLGIGFAACLLLLGFVRYSWQYNTHVPEVDQVYVVKQRHNIDPTAPWYDQAPLVLHPAAARIPGIAASTSFIPSRPQNMKLTARIDGQLHHLNAYTVPSGFVETLRLQALQGDLKSALELPDSFVVTRATAIKLFGTANALGRTAQVEGKLIKVGAILPDPPSNTTIPIETLFGLNSVLTEAMIKPEMLTGEQGWWGKVLIRVQPGASIPAVTAALQQVIDTTPSIQKIPPAVKERLGKRKVMDVALAPLRHAYFDQDVTGTHLFVSGDRASPAVVGALGAIALLILALAAINYVNLATVRVLQRQREVAMRKVLGAGARQIALQLLAESLLVAMLATAIGLLLAWLLLPLFSELVNRELESTMSAANIAAALAIGAVLGVATAAYPAWIALRVRPTRVLAGRADTETRRGMQLRRVMTVMQVATAMVFASVALAVAWQTRYAMQASPGFDPAPLLIVDLPEPLKDSAKARGFVAALTAQPGVAGVASSEDAVGRRVSSWFREFKRPGGAGASLDMKSVSANFFQQYRIAPQAGRLFDPAIDKEDDPVPLVINAIAARELGFATPPEALGQTVLFTDYDGRVVPKRIVGIAPDLRFDSLHTAPRATAYQLWTAGYTLSVRSADTLARLEPLVQAVWPKYFPDLILKMTPAREIFAASYAEEARIARLLAIATGIALAIAAFGTYVLSAHTVQRRAREIVLRKLYGARRADIGLLVVREIAGLTLVAALIALPLAAIAIQRYLATYVEHAPIGYWTLFIALASTLIIALVAVGRHAWLAMRMMASSALRA